MVSKLHTVDPGTHVKVVNWLAATLLRPVMAGWVMRVPPVTGWDQMKSSKLHILIPSASALVLGLTQTLTPVPGSWGLLKELS
jgi:hypothetical protein